MKEIYLSSYEARIPCPFEKELYQKCFWYHLARKVGEDEYEGQTLFASKSQWVLLEKIPSCLSWEANPGVLPRATHRLPRANRAVLSPSAPCLPTPCFLLTQTLIRSSVGDAFVLCLHITKHEKVWAHGLHSWCQHRNLSLLTKTIISTAPSRRTFTCSSLCKALATLIWLWRWCLYINTDRRTIKPFIDVHWSS